MLVKVFLLVAVWWFDGSGWLELQHHALVSPDSCGLL